MIRNLLFFILVVTLYSCNNRQKETPKADAFAKMEMDYLKTIDAAAIDEQEHLARSGRKRG